MKAKATPLFLAAAIAAATFAQASTPTWEDRATGSRDKDGASEWWATTWKTGDHVETVSKYRFYGRLQVRKEDKPELKWYSILAAVLETDHEVDIQGTSKCANNVLSGGKDKDGKEIPVQLIRSFECPISARGASVVGLKNGDKVELKLAKAYAQFYEFMQDPEVQTFLRHRIDEGKVLLRGLIHAKLAVATGGISILSSPMGDQVIKIAIDGVDAKVTAFASQKAAEIQKKAIERIAGGTFDKEGGIEAKRKSIFYRALPGGADEIVNFAVTFNQLFDGKDFYLCAAKGDRMFVKQLNNTAGEEGEALRLLLAEGPVSALPEKMQDLEPTADEAKVANTLSRETFNVNAVLFDLRERKPGDTWAASADLMNNFLHPDLKGSFRGIVCLQYEGDESLSLTVPEVASKTFKARHLRMTERKAGTETNFEYYEPPRADGTGEFRFTYSPGDAERKAEIDIWVDTESGYILKAVASMDGEVTYLPDLLLTRGWSFKDGNGKVRLDIESESWPSKQLNSLK